MGFFLCIFSFILCNLFLILFFFFLGNPLFHKLIFVPFNTVFFSFLSNALLSAKIKYFRCVNDSKTFFFNIFLQKFHKKKIKKYFLFVIPYSNIKQPLHKTIEFCFHLQIIHLSFDFMDDEHMSHYQFGFLAQ